MSPAAAERFVNLVEMAVTGSLMDEVGRCLPPTGGGHYECPLNKLLPYSKRLRSTGDDWPAVGHTMVGHKRLKNIRSLLETVTEERIPGSFVELGVWRGGAGVYAKAVMDVLLEDPRELHMFDVYGKMGAYTDSKQLRGSNFLAVPVERVRHNFEKYGLLDERVHLHQGLFVDTLPRFRQSMLGTNFSIAVLRIDGNFIDSHFDALFNMWDFVSPGGYIIFDDGMKKFLRSAITRFMTDQGISMRMHAIDDLGIYGRKQKGNNQVVVDWSKWPRKYPFDCNRNASLATVNRNATALDWEPELEPEGEAATRRSR